MYHSPWSDSRAKFELCIEINIFVIYKKEIYVFPVYEYEMRAYIHSEREMMLIH